MIKLLKLFIAAISAAFFMTAALAQNAGTVTNHAFVLGKGAGTTGYTSLLCASAQLAVGQSASDPICRTVTGDVTITAAGVTAIGASKVTNSQLNTMAANTTKCNATGGTANPTDCTASTMKTNLGLVIGTNVEAWDNDLDCVAALATTGQIKRTGTGTCSAGAVALSDLATGTQDTVIGYFGSTTSSAVAISNCTGALTYSTSTHTFGCNAAAGTGTVTSVTCGTGLSGGAITTTGTCALALNSAIVSTQPSNPAGTTSATVVMMGLGVSTCRITPTYSTRIEFEIYGDITNSVAGTVTVRLSFGTGAGPANGAAAAGTVTGSSLVPSIASVSDVKPFKIGSIVQSLTAGTTYWFDLEIGTNGGTANALALTCIAREVL